MKRLFVVLISTIVFLFACKKEITIRTSGTDTINNTIHPNGPAYYVLGFSFSQAKLMQESENSASKPDIVLLRNLDNAISPLILQANNRPPSFLKIDEYDTEEEEAKTAFNNLKTVPEGEWIEMINPVAPNQVWVYMSNNEKHTKFRIVSIINEMRENIPYGECTFQWVHQPDGSVNFP